MLEQLTDGQRMELALAICPELGEIKQFGARVKQQGFQQGYGHGVSDVGTPEQAEATAEWRADTSHGDGPERFDVATKPPFSKGSDWIKSAADFSQTLAGLASPFLGKLMEKRIYDSEFVRERLVQDAIKQLQQQEPEIDSAESEGESKMKRPYFEPPELQHLQKLTLDWLDQQPPVQPFQPPTAAGYTETEPPPDFSK